MKEGKERVMIKTILRINDRGSGWEAMTAGQCANDCGMG